MSDMKLEVEQSMTRQQAAETLSALAKALTGDGKADLDLGGTTVSLRVPDELRAEFEVEVEGDEVELEVELKWSTVREPATSPSPGEAQQPPRAERPQRVIPSL